MSHSSHFSRAGASVAGVLLSGLFFSLAQGAGPSPQSSPPPARTAQGGALAAGASEDSLQACLARIPGNATIGQRLIAEQSCLRDEGDRKSFQAAPGR